MAVACARETGYGMPQVSNLFVLPSGLPGNNTALKTQTNLGYDLGADWTYWTTKAVGNHFQPIESEP